MNTLVSRGALACALLATTALASPALAQSATNPSVYKNVDENGVDMTDGSFNFAFVEGSIGSGRGAIALVRSLGAGGQTDNLFIRFTRQTASGTARFSLTFGNRRETFSGPATATTFTSGQADGAILQKLSAGSYRYTDDDGAVTLFDVPPGLTDAVDNGYCGPGSEDSCVLVANQTTEPDGLVTTYQWDVGENCYQSGIGVGGEPVYSCAQFWRLRGISNNFGYRIRFSFAQEANPTSGTAGTAWHQRTGATLHNDSVASSPRAVTYAYPSSSVTEITTDGGRRWRISNQASSIAIRRPGASSDNISVQLDANRKVTQATVDGVTTSYSRPSADRTVATNALGQSRTVVSDVSIGRPTQVTDELNRTTNFQYDATGRLTRTTAPEGDAVQLSYDVRGNVTETRAVAKPGSGLSDIVTTAGFDASCSSRPKCNQPNWTRDGAGNQTDYAYNLTTGQPLSVTAPAGPNGVRPQMRYGYSSVNGVSVPTSMSTCQTGSQCVGTADEVRTTIGYGANRLPVSVSQGAGDGSLTATTAMSYTPAGDVATVDGPLPGAADTTRIRYNAAREAVGVIGPDPDGAGPLRHRAVRTSFDAEGKPLAQETGTVTDQSDAAWGAFQSLQRADVVYDANGRPVKQSVVAGGNTYGVSEQSYDALGRPECAALRMNPANFGGQTNACQLSGTGSDGPDRITRTAYNAASEVTEVRVGVGTAEEAAEASFGYTPNGQLERLTDGEGNRTTYVYDGHDRLRQTRYPVPQKGANASSTSDYEELGYDARSLVTSRRLRDGQVIGFSHDALGRMTLKNLPGLHATEADVTYAYDNLGRLSQARDANGSDVRMSYDALGRLTSEGNWYGTNNYQYDLAGRRTRLTRPFGYHVEYGYLTTGETSTIREAGGFLIAGFGYDDLGRRTRLSRGNGATTSYGYDPASRLTSLSHDLAGTSHDQTYTYAYNPAGQVTRRTGSNDAYAFAPYNSDIGETSNGLNQVVGSGIDTFSYDGRGNFAADAFRTYGYTTDGRLWSVNGAFSYYYDPLGRLENRMELAQLQGYDGDDLVAEYADRGATVVRSYVHGPGDDEPLIVYENGTHRFLHADERGSIVAHSDAGGTGVAINRYGEFGDTHYRNHVGRFGYTGQAFLPEIALYNYKARMYIPGMGKFMQPDPIGYDDGPNMYAYVGMDPVNFTDPTGLEGCDFSDAKAGDELVCGPKPHVELDRGVLDPGGGRQNPQPYNPFAELTDNTEEVIVTGTRCNATCQLNRNELLRTSPRRWVLIGGRYEFNPWYRDPYPWLNLEKFVEVQLSLFPIGKYTSLGREIVISKNFRLAPFGNRTGHRLGERPHWHYRPSNPVPPGQSIGRHRPWE